MVSLDSPPNEAKYRCHWTAPMAIDPFDPNNVLYGCQLILKTSNGGQSWTEFSPDLSTKDPSRIVSNGGCGPNADQKQYRNKHAHFAEFPNPRLKAIHRSAQMIPKH